MKRRSILTAVAATVLLAGCASPPSRDPNLEWQGDARKALLLFTVTHDWGPPAPVTGWGTGGSVRFYVTLQGEGLGSEGQTFASLTDPGLTAMRVQTPFDNLWGRFYVLEVPAGKYLFTQWSLSQLTGVGERRLRPKVPPSPLAFELTGGSVTYIGNLHANLEWGKNPFGMTLLAGGVPVVRDESQRDLEVIYKTYPKLKGLVQIAPLKPVTWLAQPGS